MFSSGFVYASVDNDPTICPQDETILVPSGFDVADKGHRVNRSIIFDGQVNNTQPKREININESRKAKILLLVMARFFRRVLFVIYLFSFSFCTSSINILNYMLYVSAYSP